LRPRDRRCASDAESGGVTRRWGAAWRATFGEEWRDTARVSRAGC
jgi:hypothetical protein